ncbi:MAG: hypothetical protein WC391_03420 [Methanoregula sp.]
MELSENERLMLVKKKEEICKITSELKTGKLNNSQKIAKINEVISLLSTIESYAKPDRDLSAFSRLAIQISHFLEIGFDADVTIDIFCTAANSVKFDFTKRGLIISIPIQIKEAILNKIQFG